MEELGQSRDQVVSSVVRGDRGASLVEYALLVSLIAVVCIAAVMFFGSEASESFSSTADSISAA